MAAVGAGASSVRPPVRRCRHERALSQVRRYGRPLAQRNLRRGARKRYSEQILPRDACVTLQRHKYCTFMIIGPCAGRSRSVIAGHGRVAMPPSISSLTSRWAADFRGPAISLACRVRSRSSISRRSSSCSRPNTTTCRASPAFLLTWGLLNFAWLAVLRRPGVSAVLSLAMVAILIQVSELKYKVVWQTVDFVDLMIIDPQLVRLSARDLSGPDHLRRHRRRGRVCRSLMLLWRLDPFRMPRLAAIAGAVACLLGLVGLSVTHPF